MNEDALLDLFAAASSGSTGFLGLTMMLFAVKDESGLAALLGTILGAASILLWRLSWL